MPSRLPAAALCGLALLPAATASAQCDDLLVAQRARTAGRRGTDAVRECVARGTLRHRSSARRLRAALRRHAAAGCRPVLREQLVGWTKPVWPAARRARR